jgi:biotin carboxylase
VRAVLFVGAGRHQRRAIERARRLGVRVVAVDRNADAPGFAGADAAEAIDFGDVEAVVAAARRHAVRGVLTVAAERAVPVVAAVAEALGLPGIGSETAHAMTNKIAMRRRLADAGVPQPRFAGVRTLHEGRAALETVGLPAVLKPVDGAGQRGLFRLDSVDDLESHLHAALAASTCEEAIVESYHEGAEVNTLLVAHGGAVHLVTASDRLRPRGAGFGVALAHLYPSRFFGDVLDELTRVAVASVHALGLREGIAYPQLLVTDEGVRVVEVAARIPGGQMGDVPRYGVGVDLVHVAVRQAVGAPLPAELISPRFDQPLAVRFLTAEPGPLSPGRVRRVGSVDPVLAAPGVVQADVYLVEGETIRPVERDGDRRGYVIALGDTTLQALGRADAAAASLDVDVEVERAPDERRAGTTA